MTGYLIASLGLVFILKYGEILNFIREPLRAKSVWIDKLLNCSLCLGFWTGLLLSPFASIEWFLFPLASSAFCWFFDSLLELIQLQANKLDE